MKKVIISLVCLLAIFSACEKVVYKDPSDTPPVDGLSFASDVVPVLTTCNACHVHDWTTSSVASTFYTNLVNDGYVKTTAYTTSSLYTKMNGGHPGTGSMPKATTDKIITWMQEGSKNN